MENISRDQFVFVNEDTKIVDKPLETKRISYYQDVWNQFKKNKMAFVAFIIICILFFFIIFGPDMKRYTPPKNPGDANRLDYLPPKAPVLEKIGIFTGRKKITRSKEFLVEMAKSEYGKDIIKKGMPKELLDDDPENDGEYKTTPLLTVVVDMYRYKNYIHSIKDESNSYERLKREMTQEEFDKALKDNVILEVLNVTRSEDGYHTYTVRVDFFQYALGQKPEDTYFWYGTDDQGRDLFTMLWTGARISLLLAISITIINAIIGLTIGAISGYYGGTFDLIFDRFVDILAGIPFMAVLTLLILRFGSQVWIVIMAFTMTGWISSYSMARMQFYRFKNREYVLAARTLGAKDPRIMYKHIFPNAIGYMITSFALSIPSFVFAEANFSYLGIINYSNAVSVGMLLQHGQRVMATDPHMILFPAIYISILMITFNLLGNGLRDAFNPSLRGAV